MRYSNEGKLKENAGQIIPNNTEQWKVLYTHTIENEKRVVYDLEKYPISKEYLLSHYDQLSDEPPPVSKDFNDFLMSYLGIARRKQSREKGGMPVDCLI